MQELIERITTKVGMDISRDIDRTIQRALKQKSPFAFWLLGKLPYPWVGRMLGLELQCTKDFLTLAWKYKLLIHNRLIAKFEVLVDVMTAETIIKET